MDSEREPALQEGVREWKRRGFTEVDGGLSGVELVKYPELSVPLLLLWFLLGLWPGLLYLAYWKLKSEDRVRLSLAPGGMLLVDRDVSFVNRAGPVLGWLYVGLLGLALVSGVVALLLLRPADGRKVPSAQPQFQVVGMPVFVPGTASVGPKVRWEGKLVHKGAVPWPALELECRARYRRGTGEVEMRASRSALAGHGQDSWKVEPAPSPERPFLPGESRAFRCETLPGKHVGVAQPVDAVMDVLVQAPNGRFAWTTGPQQPRPASP